MLDCAIIGGGPAGLTAGLYATRGGLKEVVLFEMGLPGGQITQSSEIENYPGFFDATKSGMDFMQSWQEQCFSFGLKHEMAKVVSIAKEGEIFIIRLEDGTAVEAKSVILSTGSKPKKAGFKGEDDYFGKGVSSCATCDGFFYKDKPVSVLGGGDTALEEAYYLSNIASHVHIIHRRDSFKAAPTTIERVMKKSNITIHYHSEVESLSGDAMGLSEVTIVDIKSAQKQTLPTPGLFVFVGYEVNNSLLLQSDEPLCRLNSAGEVVVDLKMQTSLEGLFCAGDMRQDASKQVVCAAGDGATAALGVISYLQERGE